MQNNVFFLAFLYNCIKKMISVGYGSKDYLAF